MHPQETILATLFMTGCLLTGLVILYLTPGHRNAGKRHTKGSLLAVGIGIIAIPAAVVVTFWPQPAAGAAFLLLGVAAVCQTCIILRQRKLREEMLVQHFSKSAFALPLGTLDDTEHGEPVWVWFKRTQEEWPPVRIEFGISHHSIQPKHASDDVRGKILRKITHMLTKPNIDGILKEGRENLQACGVTHPLDIAGQDIHPAMKELVERILNEPIQNPST